ncbi:GAF domain-containing protein [Fortiea contorta]|uniref:GAF domain-containing protein n=1 Tax=Fortiea contorta TaxID=1892405 RepID=UPI0003466586|nr:GAF domain-containing protein [Fortiea contorta]
MNLISKSDVRVSLEQETLLRRITNRIRQTLELEDIITTTATEMRSLLGTDRVMIYKFHSDGSGQVIAESIDQNRLPSLLGLNFPADDIPPLARELFIKSRVRSVVDLDTNQIGQIHLNNLETEDIHYRPIAPCHVDYLSAMGVKSTVVAPILYQEQLWGLLVSHHSQSSAISEYELEAVQIVVDQLAIAIAQSNLLTQAREKASREAIINRVATRLHSLTSIELQPALAEIVTTYSGSGGRLCIKNQTSHLPNITVNSFRECLASGEENIKIYTYGQQPIIPHLAKNKFLEQYLIWDEHYQCGKYDIWAIADIYHHPNLRNLQAAFHQTKIRSILVIPLHYCQELLGFLTIFRDEIDTETLWAGQFDSDKRQLYPRLSFEVWRESKTAQAREWNKIEIELAQEISQVFALAIQQYQLYQQVQAFNSELENQVQERTTKLQQAIEQQHILFEVVMKMRKSLDMDTIFQTTTSEIRRVLNADRVAVYRFDSGSEFNNGEFITENVLPDLPSALTAKIHDHCFGENYATQYTQGRIHVVSDIDNARMQDCHIAILSQFYVRAQIVNPIMKNGQLWGLLCIHQCTGIRHWEDSEIQFAIQVANQLGVAIEQADLLTQTQELAVDLQQAADQQRVLFEVVTKIRESLDLNVIFQASTQVVCNSLQTDRVAVYQFNPDWSGEYIAEFVDEGWVKLVGLDQRTAWKDTYLQENSGGRYRHNETFAVHDIYQANHSNCHIQILEQLQAKAYVIAPIFIGQKLWGLLAAYQNSAPRHWEASEIKFMAQIANQLGVALQQANLFTQTQQQAQQLTKAFHDLQEAQTQLIQTEKMSSLGQLVAGIAHEINNPVNFIYGNLAHVSEYAEDLLGMLELYQQHAGNTSPEIEERVEDIDLEFVTEDLPKTLASMKMGIDRIRQIVLGLRNFSRLDEAEMKAVNIHDGIDSTLLILQHRLKARPECPAIQLIKDYGDLPLVECYAGQMNQVFMNVLSNAIDALEDYKQPESGSHHQINIVTRFIETQNKVESVLIRIADNGPGIPETVKIRICDPFFTTKPVGKGTGLGLSISYKIVVDKHGGIFKCESQLGRGTEFWIEIPVRHVK